jgi:hypothetical protein
VRYCDGLGSNIVVQYSVGPIISLHGRITEMEYVASLGNQNDRGFPRRQCPIHTAGTVQSWFEEHHHNHSGQATIGQSVAAVPS